MNKYYVLINANFLHCTESIIKNLFLCCAVFASAIVIDQAKAANTQMIKTEVISICKPSEAIRMPSSRIDSTTAIEHLEDLGWMALAMRDFQAGAAAFYKACDTMEESNSSPSVRARVMLGVGISYQAMKWSEKSEQALQYSTYLFQSLKPADHSGVVQALLYLGKLYSTQGRWSEATSIFERGQTVASAHLPETSKVRQGFDRAYRKYKQLTNH